MSCFLPPVLRPLRHFAGLHAMTLPVIHFADLNPLNRPGDFVTANGCSAAVLYLTRSVNPEVVIEFGVYKGDTSLLLLSNCPTIKRYIGIEVPCSHFGGRNWQEINLEVLECPKFELRVLAFGTRAVNPVDLPQADIIFIDGDHTLSAVKHDSALARAIIKKGGMIIWHDYSTIHDVTVALDADFERGYALKHVVGTAVAFEKID